jgi:hypothetical protein
MPLAMEESLKVHLVSYEQRECIKTDAMEQRRSYAYPVKKVVAAEESQASAMHEVVRVARVDRKILNDPFILLLVTMYIVTKSASTLARIQFIIT